MTAAVEVRPVRIGPEGYPDLSRTLGVEADFWAHTYLQQPDGPNAGQPWEFTPEQRRFLLWFYAIDEAGRFTYRSAVYRRMKGSGKNPFAAALSCIEFVGPCRFGGWREDGTPIAIPNPAAWVQIAAVSREQTRNSMTLFPSLFSKQAITEYGIDLGKEIIYADKGKRRLESVTSSPRAMEGGRATFSVLDEALALDTPLPTPAGWTTVGAVKAGDTIYGSSGPVSVVKTTPIHTGRPCFVVKFEDGSEIVADEGHLWYVKTVASAAKPRVMTTAQMAMDGRKFAVPLAEPLDSPEVELPLDPYMFGYWLGDGDTKAANITCGTTDLDWVSGELTSRGFLLTRLCPNSTRAPRLGIRIEGCRRNRNDPRPLGVRGRLQALGVIGAKFVPELYLRGSRAQRLDLLRGLMDSDGHCGPSSLAVFVNQNEHVAAAVAELARSLGYQVRVSTRVDTRWSEPKRKWLVVFRASEDANPFLMPRKAALVTGTRRPWKTITAITPTESVPVRCIEVDSPDHLFVAGTAWTLTHNTHHWLEHNEGHAMAEVIARNLAKSRDGSARSLAITNAHNPGEDSVAERDWEAYEKVLAGTTVATGILYDSLEAPPDTVLADRDSLRAGILAARGDSDWLDVDRLIEEIYDPRTLPSVARRFYLNQIVAAEDAWITPQEWDAVADTAHEVPAGAAITLGFDGSRSNDHTALVACEVDTGHLFTPTKADGRPSVWNPADYGQDLPRAEIDATVRRMFEQYDVVGFYSDYSPFESYVDRWEEDLGAKLCVSAAPHHPIRWDFRTRQRDAAVSAESLHEAIVAGNVTHDGSPLARWYVLNARSRLTNYGVTFGKGNASSPDKVDWLAAAMVARQARQDYIALPSGKKRQKARKARFYNFAESGAAK